MKNLMLLFSTVLISMLAIGQDKIENDQKTEEKKINVTVNGYIRYEAIYDSYRSVESREGEVYLYPGKAIYDANGEDINKINQLEMLSLQSRLKFGITGPDAFGAKTSGVIEGDFLGISNADVRQLRLRHAFIKMNWSKYELIMGQYWHPMFVTQNFPSTLSMGAGVPFHVLNRSPQIRATYKILDGLTISETILMHGYHLSSGPADAQRNAGIPDCQFQLVYTKGILLTGFTIGNKWLKPRLITLNSFATDKVASSMNANAFLKLKLKPVTIKLEGIYGENLTNFTMIGGYGAAQNPTETDDYSYSNLQTISFWGDVESNGKKVIAGFFAGYAANLGSTDPYFALSTYTRSADIGHIFRISPRIMMNSGPVQLGLEYLLTGAAYDADGVLDANGKPDVLADPTIDHRILFTAKYSF